MKGFSRVTFPTESWKVNNFLVDGAIRVIWKNSEFIMRVFDKLDKK